MSKIYSAYGLTLESDLPLPGVCACSEPVVVPDIRLFFTMLPAWAAQALALPVTSARTRPALLEADDTKFTISEYADRRFFQLTYGDGTRFVVDAAARCIWGEPGPGLSHEDVCIYLLGPVLGFVLRQRGVTTLHASAVCLRDRAAALVGAAGAGKSTTAAALALRGWPVLCEDVCALRERGGQFHVVPGYPRVGLWPDSTEFLFSSREELPLMVAGWEKRFLALDGSRAHFAKAGAPLAAIFLLQNRVSSEDAPRIESISPRAAILHLVQNTYMNWYLDKRQRAGEFDVLARLLATAECFSVTPSADPRRLPALIELIENAVLRMSRVDRAPAGAA